MIHETFQIKVPGALQEARLIVYLQEYSESLWLEERPMIVICPGGGYAYTSDREAEPIALAFLARGYHAAVLRYSCTPAQFPVALLELASSMLLIRRNAGQWHVRQDKIIVQGCSAGGHLAASLGCFWQEDFLAKALGLKPGEREMLRPAAMLLCYPVITSGEFAHRGSFEQLVGERTLEEAGIPEDAADDLTEYLSLEKRVSAATPPAFIWHTFEDGSVPVENSLMMVTALRRAGVQTEFHMYPRGAHGLALANKLTQNREGKAVQEECASWLELAATWLEHLT